jgi:hypothetical protein
LIGALAELEREILKERVIAGLNRVRAEGKILGRKPTRPSKMIRQLFKKGLTYQECARLASTSQGSVGKEVHKMKEELAIKRGLDASEAKNISTTELREYFKNFDSGKFFDKQPGPHQEAQTQTSPPQSGEFEFEMLSSSEPIELEII